MTIRQPFMPKYGSNQVIVAAAATAARVLIAGGNKQIRFLNPGADIVYVRTYSSATGVQSATTADFPVGVNQAVTLTKDEQHDTLTYFSTAGTTFHAMPGEGF